MEIATGDPNALISTPAPITPPRKSSNLYRLIIFVLILAIITVVAVFLFGKIPLSKPTVSKITPTGVVNPTVTPVLDPTINWKTYNIPEINLQFKYPENDWECPKGSCPVKEEKLSGVEIRPGEPIDCGFSVSWYNNESNLSPRDYWIQKEKDASETFESINCNGDLCKVNRNAGSADSRYTNTYQFESTTIAGKEAIRVKVIEESYAIDRDNDGIYLQATNGKIVKLEICPDEINNQILSTFKFTQ